MNPLRWLILAARVVVAELVDKVTGRKPPEPDEAARIKRSVHNALRERRLRDLSDAGRS